MKIKKYYFALLITLMMNLFVIAQEKIYFPSQSNDLEFCKIEISNVIGLTNELKFKLEIQNKTAEYLLFDASKCIFFVNDNEVVPKDKFLIIEPYKKKSKTISAIGSSLNVQNFEFKLDGIQKIVYLDEIINAEQFYLPPNSNDFVAGNFEIGLKSFRKETNATTSKYEVQYKGDKIGLIFPAKINVSMPDGNNYANAKKTDPILLLPGEKSSFNANWDRMPGGSVNDMQKVQMKINFTDVFKEGKTVDANKQHLKFNWDETLTKEKNK